MIEKKIGFNLSKEISNFLSLVSGSTKNHDIKIILDLDDNINLNSYPNELIQCFMNLFNNSKDAFKEEDKEKYIFISTKAENEKVIISFKDNAGGIPEEILDKIFIPYFTTKHQSMGTGLGLSITYNLINEGLAGKICANNVEYIYENLNLKGAQFNIELPIK